MQKKNAYSWKCPVCGHINHEDPDMLPAERPCTSDSCDAVVEVVPDDSKTWQEARREQ